MEKHSPMTRQVSASGSSMAVCSGSGSGFGGMGSTGGDFVHTAAGPSSRTSAGAGLTGTGGRWACTALTRASEAGVFGWVMAARYCSAVMVWKKGSLLPCPAFAGVRTGDRSSGCAGASGFGSTASTLPGVRFSAERAP